MRDENLRRCRQQSQGSGIGYSRRPPSGRTNVAWCPTRWSGGVMSTSSALRFPLWFTGVSSTDFSETDLRPGSLAVRGVRCTRTGVGVCGGEVGKTAVDGPNPPFSFEVDGVGVDGSLS